MAQIKGEKKNNFFGDVAKLVSGTTIAKIIGIIAAPVISRLYLPEAFGVTALFVSISGIIVVISNLRYDLTVMLPENEIEAVNLFSLSVCFVFLISILTTVLIWFTKGEIASLLDAPAIEPFLWLVPITVFLKGIYKVFSYWNTRTKDYGRLAIAQGLSSVTNTGSQLGAGFSGFATNGAMIGANIAGYGVSAFFLVFRVLKEHGEIFFRYTRWKRMMWGMRRYYEFPLYGTWAALLNNISWQLPNFMLAYFFSTTVVGFYALGNRLLQLPMNLIGSAIGQVFFQRAAEARNEGNLGKVVERVFERLVKLGFFPLLILAVVGDKLFVVVFGSQWLEAGIYTQILSIWTFFWFISSPLSTLFSVLEKQNLSLKINFLVFITRIIALIGGGLMNNVYWALAFFALSGILVYGYLIFVVMNEAGVNWRVISKILLKNLMLFLPGGIILCILRFSKIKNLIVLISSVMLLITYLVYLFYTDKELKRHLNGLKKYFN